MTKLTRSLGHRDEEVTYNQWDTLHSDMMLLQTKVFRCISPALCHEVGFWGAHV